MTKREGRNTGVVSERTKGQKAVVAMDDIRGKADSPGVGDDRDAGGLQLGAGFPGLPGVDRGTVSPPLELQGEIPDVQNGPAEAVHEDVGDQNLQAQVVQTVR